jgi:hypothetical protein
MSSPYPSLDLQRLRVLPLEQRRSLTRVEDILIDPDAPGPDAPEITREIVAGCAEKIRVARQRGAAVMLIYGAHLLRNGAALLIDRLLDGKWVTHLATNGAGTIHDWEYAWLGRSTESVEENVATGTFGTWEETGRNINLALLAGGARGEGYGTALGRFIAEDGTDIPAREDLTRIISTMPEGPLTAARADLVRAMTQHGIGQGRYSVEHRWKQASILATAWRHRVPMTVHPGVGYDIIANHPMFSGAAIGRAAEIDFGIFGRSVEQLDGGVVLSIGSAIMGPQVFEKSLSCVHNLRLQEGRPLVGGHSIYVVDLQDGGGWDWTKGEPPKTNAAYYLRFCKSFSRMGGEMHYAQCDNALFVRLLHEALCGSK